jgi:hypothetical protein
VWIRIALVVAAALACAPGAHAERRTVCSITVNSADEKDAFRRRLPPGQYDFVELIEKGRTRWLESACRRGVQCDVLVVSGHFNAGDDFYSDRIDNGDFLSVDELERASCSESCPGIFSRLKEVYLFGCESLNPEATRNASHGESSRERMRRIFSNVPVIYGFSSAAPVGSTAAMLLGKYFDAGGAGEIARGRASATLLRIFGRNSIAHARGVSDSPADSAYRRQICQLFDDRLSAAQKLDAIHRMMQSDQADARAVLGRIEKLLASMPESARASPEFARALARIAGDERTRERFLATARATVQPDTRVRLVALAGTFGWLSAGQQRAEHGRMVAELLGRNAMGFAEVDLVCSLNKDGALEDQIAAVTRAPSRASSVARAAALACLGSAAAHAQVIGALSSADVNDVRLAQAYLRNRPVTDARELRTIASGVARMRDPEAQVRALDTLARLRISDRTVLDQLTQAFAESKSLGVQRAIAEVFIRSGYRQPELAAVLREHRLRSGKGEDLIDELIRRLQSTT